MSHFQDMSKLVSCTFRISIFQEAPQKPSFKKIFLERWGRDMSTNPLEYTFTTWPNCLKVQVSCILLLCSGDQNRMYFLSCHVGRWQNGNVTPCSIFHPIKFYQLLCLSKINCCVTGCNLFFVGFV